MRLTWRKFRSDTKRGGSVELSRFFYEKVKFLSWILLGLVLFSGSSDAFRGVFQDGIYAAQRGDYKTAYELWLSLAEQGNVAAQYNLGVMRDRGDGVPQSHKEAIKWFRLAAEQGNSEAQYNLGVMYNQGEGVLQDNVLAHMWFNLSGSRGIERATYKIKKCEEKMSPTQIEKARAMARNWRPKKVV